MQATVHVLPDKVADLPMKFRSEYYPQMYVQGENGMSRAELPNSGRTAPALLQ